MSSTNQTESLPSRYRIRCSEDIMFYDTDCGGVVHNLAYLRMIEACRTRLAWAAGLDLKGMAEENLFPVLLSMEVKYLAAARFGDKLAIEGSIDAIKRARFRCTFEVRSECDDRRFVTAVQWLAMVRMPGGKPARLPKAWTHSDSSANP